MSANKVVCDKNNIEYITVRHAMCNGARTVSEVMEMAGICNDCTACIENIPSILSSVCSCKNVSLETVVNSVKNGADTVEKVGAATHAGTGCGRCQKLIANIIELGR